jgi:phage baseplate assembly protein gpV
MANKNFKARIGIEAPLIAADNGTTAITLSDNDVTVVGDLTITSNTIKSSTGATAISLSSDDVTVADRLFVVGNIIGSNGGYTALTFNQTDVKVEGDLQVSGGQIQGPGSGSDLVIENASTIVVKNDFTSFQTDAGVTEAYFNLTGGKFTFNGADTDNTNNYNLYSHGTLGSLGNTTVGDTLFLKGSTSGNVGLKAPAVAGSATYTFPGADGTSGQVLSTNGSGTLSWATASGGGGTSLPAVKSESLAAQPWSTLPGCLYIGSIGNSLTTAAQSVRYHPFYVAAPITLTEVALSVSTATSLASCNAMIFISTVNLSSTGWQPTGNLSGGYCGEISSITTTGIKSITGLSISLSAGAYLMAVQYSNFTGTLQCRSMANQVVTGNGYALATSDGTTYAMNRTGVTYVSGTPAAAANWTNGGYGNAGHPGVVLAKWTVN